MLYTILDFIRRLLWIKRSDIEILLNDILIDTVNGNARWRLVEFSSFSYGFTPMNDEYGHISFGFMTGQPLKISFDGIFVELYYDYEVCDTLTFMEKLLLKKVVLAIIDKEC